MADVVLENVSKVYRAGIRAVDGLHLRVEDGEFVVLVGPSGCGKTTVLRLIAGLELATSGTIRIGGQVVNGLPPRDRDVAMVFQSFALYPHLTVYGNMALALKLRREARAEVDRRVREAAVALGIEDLLNRRPGTLSGGQRQRVALGRAMVRRPRVFLLDEPLSNLDADLRADLEQKLKELHAHLKATIVHVTHDQGEAIRLGRRVAVMKDGRVQRMGTPAEVFGEPAADLATRLMDQAAGGAAK